MILSGEYHYITYEYTIIMCKLLHKIWMYLIGKSPKSPPTPVVLFIRKSNGSFDWRMTECYVCYSEFEYIPRAFPFDCTHEICNECFVAYVKHITDATKSLPVCGICSKPVRDEWASSRTIMTREIAPDEWIWLPSQSRVNQPLDAHNLKLDSLQFQLVYGISPQS